MQQKAVRQCRNCAHQAAGGFCDVSTSISTPAGIVVPHLQNRQCGKEGRLESRSVCVCATGKNSTTCALRTVKPSNHTCNYRLCRNSPYSSSCQSVTTNHMGGSKEQLDPVSACSRRRHQQLHEAELLLLGVKSGRHCRSRQSVNDHQPGVHKCDWQLLSCSSLSMGTAVSEKASE